MGAYPQCPVCRQQHAQHRACRRDDIAALTTPARSPLVSWSDPPVSAPANTQADEIARLQAKVQQLEAELQRERTVKANRERKPPKTPLPRLERQRELMRKRRAAERAAKVQAKAPGKGSPQGKERAQDARLGAAGG